MGPPKFQGFFSVTYSACSTKYQQGDHPFAVRDGPTKRPQQMRISGLITLTYLQMTMFSSLTMLYSSGLLMLSLVPCNYSRTSLEMLMGAETPSTQLCWVENLSNVCVGGCGTLAYVRIACAVHSKLSLCQQKPLFLFGLGRLCLPACCVFVFFLSCVPWTLRVRRAASRPPLGSGSSNPGVRCVSVSCCSGSVANPLVRCASAVLPGIRWVAEREYVAMDSEESARKAPRVAGNMLCSPGRGVTESVSLRDLEDDSREKFCKLWATVARGCLRWSSFGCEKIKDGHLVPHCAGVWVAGNDEWNIACRWGGRWAPPL